jgi:hypothetical protein
MIESTVEIWEFSHLQSIIWVWNILFDGSRLIY